MPRAVRGKHYFLREDQGFSCSATSAAFIFIGEQLFFCNSGDDLVLSRYYSGIWNKSQGFIKKII